MVGSDGEISTEVNGTSDKSTAESHSSTPFLVPQALRSQSTAENGDKEVDEVTELFKGLKKGKKSKKPKDADGEAVEEAITADGEFDPSALKKKKKKKSTKVSDQAEDFEAKLAEAGVGEESRTEVTVEEQEGDLEKGTGIWQHDANQPISYPLLLTRFFTILQSKNPSLLEGTRSYKIPPPQCLREGNKKTIFANIAEISKRMKRSGMPYGFARLRASLIKRIDEHVQQFLFAELGTNGSVDGSKREVGFILFLNSY